MLMFVIITTNTDTDTQVTHEPFSLSKFPIIFGSILKREGIMGLWRGNMANMLRVAPYSGIQFMTYDYISRYFDRYYYEFV